MSMTPRHRERTVVPLTEGYYTIDREQPDPLVIDKPCNVAWDNDSMEDVIWDKFRERILNGQIINNPMSYVRTAMESSGSLLFEYNDTVNIYTASGHLTAWYNETLKLPEISELNVQADMARAKQKAIASIDNTPYEFGEDSLELRETLRFLRNPLGNLLGLSRKFKKQYRKRIKKLDKRAVQDLLKAHGSLWLEYRFALSPLIRSLMDALEAYSSEPPLEPPRKTARGFSFEEDSVTDVDEGANLMVFKTIQHASSQGKATILYTVSNPCYDWRYRLGFRPKDFPTTIWQIVPYSFMVDRLYDITSFSKGAINLGDPMVKILMGCYSEHNDKTRLVECVSTNNPFGTLSSSDKPLYTNFTYTRNPWVPTFSDTVPSLNLKGLVEDATKITDLITLILGNFRPF